MAQLRYVRDQSPGIRRLRTGRGFTYRDAMGSPITDKPTLARIRALVIPPAWTDVWICSVPNGHLQATGRDARRRKQYRYHPRWRQVRNETKYERLIPFAATLPRIRQQVKEHLALPGLPREKVLAMIVRLLETTFIRVGNEEYARSNGSYGLTTLRNHHVRIDRGRTELRFKGKSGKPHGVAVTDRRLARLVRQLRDLPGQELFQYLDETETPQPIDSADVNQYLREISGEDFSAKDFRTWAGTLLAARHLAGCTSDNGTEAKAYAVAAIKDVAQQLGNTVAVCRSCYIHPLVLNALGDAATAARWRRMALGKSRNGLNAEERRLVRFLTHANQAVAA
ncbi:MAG TPA: DNA topoisomerase IB [Gemmatimonadaceae bacterium]|nr:DNA topoisomerase IB [Gemmatimonadaceae bacterium]